MRRLLQVLALLQLALVVVLGLRVVDTMRVAPPTFGEVPDLPALTPLPPAKPRAKADEATAQAIVGADLFDSARGVHDADADGAGPDETPLPPPANVKVSGIMFVGEPVAILSDPAVGPDQRTLRQGDMFGDYEVGDISTSSVVLKGSAGQQFRLDLKVEAGGGSAPAPGQPARPTSAAARAATPRPGATPARTPTTAAARTLTPRERAQALAARNAAIRAARAATPGGRGAQGEAGAGGVAGAPDPVQERLEALRRLRDAAKTR